MERKLWWTRLFYESHYYKVSQPKPSRSIAFLGGAATYVSRLSEHWEHHISRQPLTSLSSDLSSTIRRYSMLVSGAFSMLERPNQETPCTTTVWPGDLVVATETCQRGVGGEEDRNSSSKKKENNKFWKRRMQCRDLHNNLGAPKKIECKRHQILTYFGSIRLRKTSKFLFLLFSSESFSFPFFRDGNAVWQQEGGGKGGEN